MREFHSYLSCHSLEPVSSTTDIVPLLIDKGRSHFFIFTIKATFLNNGSLKYFMKLKGKLKGFFRKSWCVQRG